MPSSTLVAFHNRHRPVTGIVMIFVQIFPCHNDDIRRDGLVIHWISSCIYRKRQLGKVSFKRREGKLNGNFHHRFWGVSFDCNKYRGTVLVGNRLYAV